MEKKFSNAFGIALRKARYDKRLTQDQLSEKVGVASAYISMLESGKNSPSFDVLLKLADALDVTPAVLLSPIDMSPCPDFPQLKKAVSRVLNHIYIRNGMTIRQLISISSIDAADVAHIAHNNYRPTLNSIFYLAAAFGIPATELVKYIENEQITLQRKEEDNSQKLLNKCCMDPDT